jgi:uncharacterized protein GlcG (DUF336 family)
MAATFDRASVTAELARAMIEAAERKAAEMGQPFVIAVVDGGRPRLLRGREHACRYRTDQG